MRLIYFFSRNILLLLFVFVCVSGCGTSHCEICDPDVIKHCDLVDKLAVFLDQSNQILEKMTDVESANLHSPEFHQKLIEFSAIHSQLASLPDLNEYQEEIFNRMPAVQRLESVSNYLANTLKTMKVSHPDEPVFDEISKQIDFYIIQTIRQGAEESQQNQSVQ